MVRAAFSVCWFLEHTISLNQFAHLKLPFPPSSFTTQWTGKTQADHTNVQLKTLQHMLSRLSTSNNARSISTADPRGWPSSLILANSISFSLSISLSPPFSLPSSLRPPYSVSGEIAKVEANWRQQLTLRENVIVDSDQWKAALPHMYIWVEYVREVVVGRGGVSK